MRGDIRIVVEQVVRLSAVYEVHEVVFHGQEGVSVEKNAQILAEKLSDYLASVLRICRYVTQKEPTEINIYVYSTCEGMCRKALFKTCKTEDDYILLAQSVDPNQILELAKF